VRRPTPELTPGATVGAHRILRLLGKGASAHVYLARAPDGRDVALKLRPRGDPDQDRRFLREFESLRRLALPGVVTVHDAGHTAQWLYYTMEVVEGAPLRSWVHQRSDPRERVRVCCEVGLKLCETLATIHRAGFVHRDLKPSNVLVTQEGAVRVLDFGVVRWWAVEEEITGTGGMVGTIPFMAPEQVVGLPLSPAADIFAVGLLLYEGIAGKRPSAGSTHGWIARQILGRLKPLICLNPDIPAGFSSLVEQCLALEPRHRPTALELAYRLKRVLEGQTAGDWPEPHLFLGRTLEMDPLMRAMAGHGPRLVVIRGRAGDGRRRLVERARRQALLTGRRTEYGTCKAHVPGSCIGEVLERVLGSSPKEDWNDHINGAQVRALLEMWPSLPLESEASPQGWSPATRSDVVKAAVALLKATAKARPMVVTLDALDQLDALSARILESLALDSSVPLSVLSVLDTRWTNPVARDFLGRLETLGRLRSLELPELDDEDATAVASCLVPEGEAVSSSAGRPSEAVRAGLRRLSELRGVPFRAPGAEAGLLAMAGGPLPGQVADWCVGDARPLINGGLVTTGVDGRLAFCGDHVRRASEEGVVDRAGAHVRLATAWAEHSRGEQRWVEVARHRVAAGAEDTTLWQAAARAAIAAERLGRYATARNWLLMLDDVPKDRSTIAYRRLSFPLAWTRARIAHMCDTERVRRDLVEQAAARAGEPLDKHRVALLLIQARQREGDPRGALVQAVRSGEAVADADAQLAAQVALAEADARLELGQVDRALERCEQAERRLDPGQYPLEAMELAMMRGRCLVGVGRLTEATDVARKGHLSARRLRLPRAQATFALVMAHCHRLRGQRRQAEGATWEARELFREHSDQHLQAEAALEMGRLTLERGEVAAAGVYLEQARHAAHKLGRRALIADSHALDVELAAMTGDVVRLAEAQQEVERGALRTDTTAMAEARAGRILRSTPDLEDAARRAPEDGYAAALVRLELARHLLDLERPEEARRPLREGLGIAQEGELAELMLYGRLLAGLMPPVQDEGWERLVARSLREPWVELYLGGLELDGRRRKLRGDLRGARQRFDSLRMRAEDLGLKPYVDVAERLRP